MSSNTDIVKPLHGDDAWPRKARSWPTRRIDRMEGPVSATLGTMFTLDDALLPFHANTTILRCKIHNNGSKCFSDNGNNSKKHPSHLLTP